MKAPKDILIRVFQPEWKDCTTVSDDLREAITENPSLEMIEEAMVLYAKKYHKEKMKKILKSITKANIENILTGP